MSLDKLSDQLEKVLDIVGMAFLIVLAASFTIAVIAAGVAAIFEMIRAVL